MADADAGVVDQHVNAAHRANCLGQRGFHLHQVGDVGDDGFGQTGQLVPDGITPLSVAVQDADLRTFLQKSCGGGGADSAGTTGDEYPFPCQTSHTKVLMNHEGHKGTRRKLALTKGSWGDENSALDRFAAEEVNQFDDQDDHHHQFEYEGAGLVELIDHEVVELLSGAQLLLYQVLVVRYADFRCRQLVEAGGKHVAEELDGVVGAFGQFTDVEQHGVQLGGGPRRPPACPEPRASLVEKVIDSLQFAGQEFVVVAELQQLGVRILQEG